MAIFVREWGESLDGLLELPDGIGFDDTLSKYSQIIEKQIVD